ncbi:MAG: LytR C-terminal domain-containing protein [Patescibacteria group bacterium]
MPEYIVSLNDNALKVSLNDKNGVVTSSRDLSKDLASGSRIKNSELVSKVLLEMISEMSGPKLKRLPLNFLVEPQDVYLHFITVNKNNFNVEEEIIKEAREKITNVPLEDLYFSYQKIAPFVYQFVAVDKHLLEDLLKIASYMEFSISTVSPWVLMLPKFLKLNEPCIFVSKTSNKQVVALSEMNGIYYSAAYSSEKTMDDLQELVKKLSVYKRHQPINKIYAINYESFSLDPNYEVIDLSVQGSDMSDLKGFEIHMVYESLLQEDPELFRTQINLLNLLPLPVISRKPSPVIYAGGAIVVASIVAAVLFGATGLVSLPGFNRAPAKTEIAQVTEENSETAVLSEATNGENNSENDANNSETSEATQVVLEKDTLSIYVENAAGVAGIAGRTRDYLEELGYVVTDIGNADEVGRANTLIKLKDAKLDYKDLITKDMSSEYDVVVEGGLEESSEYDVVITVGLN